MGVSTTEGRALLGPVPELRMSRHHHEAVDDRPGLAILLRQHRRGRWSRLHHNTGHKPNSVLVHLLRGARASKQLIKLDRPQGDLVSQRKSPKRGRLLDIFDELVHFTQVFPHPKLTVEVVLDEVEERRYPGHGRRRRWSTTDFEVEDRILMRVDRNLLLSAAEDLWQLLPIRLPTPFHTGHLAKQLKIQRWLAQRIAYCLRQAGAIREGGKSGNTRLYDRASDAA